MRKLWDWLGNFNNAAAILALCGVPVSAITTTTATVVGHLEHLRLSYLAILGLAVFALSLWSWIGLIWLIENAKSKGTAIEKPALDCAWGLTVDVESFGRRRRTKVPEERTRGPEALAMEL